MEKNSKKPRRKKTDLSTCQRCNETLVDANWSPSMQKHGRYICRLCWSKRQQEFEKADPNSRGRRRVSRQQREASWTPERREQERLRKRKNQAAKKFSLPVVVIQQFLSEQAPQCSICASPTPGGRGDFHIDHCHNSGSIRGLLCSGCNLMLGMAKDNIMILEKAIEYLKEHQQRADHKPENRAADGGKKI